MLVVATWPLLRMLERHFGGRRAPAVAVMTLAMLLLLVVPLWLAIQRHRRSSRGDHRRAAQPYRLPACRLRRAGLKPCRSSAASSPACGAIWPTPAPRGWSPEAFGVRGPVEQVGARRDRRRLGTMLLRFAARRRRLGGALRGGRERGGQSAAFRPAPGGRARREFYRARRPGDPRRRARRRRHRDRAEYARRCRSGGRPAFRLPRCGRRSC